MTTKTREPWHSHAIVPLLDRQPIAILLSFGTHIVVAASYCQLTDESDKAGILRVLPYDQEGDTIVRVPLALVAAWLTDGEAEDVSRCIDADDNLLAAAH